MSGNRAVKNVMVIRGIDGSDGTDGKGIASASYNSGTGVLTLTFSDNSTYQTGDLRGAAGATGKGISSTSYNASTGVLTITFTDSSIYQTGDLRGSISYGTTAGTVCQGNDSRLSDARTPTTHSHSDYLAKASNLSDLANRQTALNNLADASGGTNEHVLTKDTATGNIILKPSQGGGSSVNLNGIINLIYNDETDSAEHNTSTSESTARKTYTLAANTYSKIIIEFIVRARVEQSANTKADFTWRIKSAGATVRTFVQRIIASATTGIVSGDRLTETFSYIIDGGQVSNTDITITVQPNLSSASTGGLVHAMRIYGVMNAVTIGKGDTGAAGKGISSTSYNSSTGVLTLTYSDASTYQTGDLRGTMLDNTFTYDKIYSDLKSKATVTNTINLSANGQGEITLTGNTAFSFTGFQLNKSYLLKIVPNGYTPSWANAAKHIAIDGNATFGTSGTFWVLLTCTNATSGSEKLLTMIMKEI